MKRFVFLMVVLTLLVAPDTQAKTPTYTDPVKWSVNSVKGVADNGYIDLSKTYGLPEGIASVEFVIQAHAPANLLYGVGESLELIDWSRRTNWNDEWHTTRGSTSVSDGQLYVAFEGDMHYILYIVGYND